MSINSEYIGKNSLENIKYIAKENNFEKNFNFCRKKIIS